MSWTAVTASTCSTAAEATTPASPARPSSPANSEATTPPVVSLAPAWDPSPPRRPDRRRSLWEDGDFAGKRFSAVSFMPSERAIRQNLQERMMPRTRAHPGFFSVERFTEDRVYFGSGGRFPRAWIEWSELEEVVRFLAVRGTIPISTGTHRDPGTLGESLMFCSALISPWVVAAALDVAGIVEVLPGEPVRVRLAHTGRHQP